MANLYQPYLDQLQDVLNLRTTTETRHYPHIGGLPEQGMLQRLNKGLLKLDEQQQTSLQQVADLFGIRSYQRPKLTPHPDFAYLRSAETMTEEHYIVSMFVDVRRSTAMFKRLSKEQIHGVVNIVNRVTTHTMALFGGQVQRIMFDGTFCYFGGRNISKEQAVLDAVNAATMFCYFMERELPAYFEQHGLEKVYTRIGIDFGDANDVLWGLHGTVDCGELSTTSLHTSLAAKMQQNAASNGIVVGQHMVDRMTNGARLFCDTFRDANGNVDENKRYIFRSDALNYTQYEFNWESYLKESRKNVAHLLPDGTLRIRTSPGLPQQNDRLIQLEEKIRLMETGNGHITSQGQITAKPTGIPVPKNSFYGDDK